MSGEPLAPRILAYLQSHPTAQDTVEGIAEWWLLEERIQRRVTEVQATLDRLVKRGWLLARQGTDGRIHYRLNPEREAEIRESLRGRPRGPGSTAEDASDQHWCI